MRSRESHDTSSRRSLRRILAALAAAALLAAPGVARAIPPPHDADGIDRTATSAYAERQYAFCTNPDRPLALRQRGLCAIAAELEACDGFKGACDALPAPKRLGWLEQLLYWAAPAAKIALYLVLAGIVAAIAIPVIVALVRRRRLAREEAPRAADNRAVVVDDAAPIPELDDAEAALRLADELHAKGALDRAIGLYLAASLAALGRRGAVQLGRHRTNGEYVRACAEQTMRAPLREIASEVDRVAFGGAPATNAAVERVAGRARTIVRAAAAVAVVVALGLGCAAPRPGADPAGDELATEVLRRNGFTVDKLATSIATMPIPEKGAATPVVVVDLERVVLEDEASAHLVRWVEAGGVLVLFGNAILWPTPLRATTKRAETRDLSVETPDPYANLDDVEDDDDATPPGAPVVVDGARTTRHDAFAWSDATTLAKLGKDTYAAKKNVGRGVVVAVANDDLFTNVGLMPRRNAAALVAIVRAASHDPRRVFRSEGRPLGAVRVARAEDGIPPPANPFAALVAAGLGKGAWHALAAAVILFLAYGIRHARARPPRAPTRRAFVEHVAATGAAYARAKAHPHALAAYGRFVDLRVREAMPRGADPVAFLAERSGVAEERVRELHQRATAPAPAEGAPAKGNELATIEELRRIMEKTRR